MDIYYWKVATISMCLSNRLLEVKYRYLFSTSPFEFNSCLVCDITNSYDLDEFKTNLDEIKKEVSKFVGIPPHRINLIHKDDSNFLLN